ncbi:hypothetical protein TW85_15955 [Marinomonas sp. S3726]|nr:hypothetical protein TW85_15955 [Marinomonas sp. S3726]
MTSCKRGCRFFLTGWALFNTFHTSHFRLKPNTSSQSDQASSQSASIYKINTFEAQKKPQHLDVAAFLSILN